MRAISPFLTGAAIVSATTVGIAHVIGSDGPLFALASHVLNMATDAAGDAAAHAWNAVTALL